VFVKRRPARSATGQFNHGPANSRAANLGIPSRIGIGGSLSKISGDATTISRMGYNMYAVRTKPEQLSNGDASANWRASNPSEKLAILHVGR
jgi:hypothetical protein